MVRSRRVPRQLVLGAAFALLTACGGRVVFEPVGAGGGSDSAGAQVAVGAGGAAGSGGAGGANVAVASASSSSAASSSSSTNASSGSGASSSSASASSSSAASSSSSSGIAIPDQVATDLGSYSSGDTATFDVPPGTLGLTVIVQSANKYTQLGVKTLTPPGLAPIIDNYGIPGVGWTFAWYGITVAGIPETDAPGAMPVASGMWSMLFGAPQGNVPAAKVSLWRRQTVDGKFHGGLMDVNVFLVDGVGDQATIMSRLHSAYDGYAGLNLGQIAFYSLPATWATIDTSLKYFSVLEQTSVAAAKPALNVIVVGMLSGDFQGAGGVAASIPGQGVIHGTHASGIVMTLNNDPLIDVNVLQHEGGHLHGLFHTTEIMDATLGDALADTPHCDTIAMQPGSCADVNNVMFPYAAGGTELSPEQQTVIHGSTLYRGVVEEGGPPAPPLVKLPDPAPQARMSKAMLRALADARAFEIRSGAAPWARGLSVHAAEVLVSGWCNHGLVTDHFAILRALGADDPALLLTIGTDPSAPSFVRARALRAAGRAVPSPDVVTALVSLAQDPRVERIERIGALDGVREADEGAARVVASKLTNDPDRIVAAVAATLR